MGNPLVVLHGLGGRHTGPAVWHKRGPLSPAVPIEPSCDTRWRSLRPRTLPLLQPAGREKQSKLADESREASSENGCGLTRFDDRRNWLLTAQSWGRLLL